MKNFVYLTNSISRNIILFISVILLSANAFAQPDSVAVDPPQRNSIDVISIFGDSYSNLDGTNFNPGWGQSTTFSTEEITGSQVIKLSNLNYQGFELSGSINVSEMEFLHIDIWTARWADRWVARSIYTRR